MKVTDQLEHLQRTANSFDLKLQEIENLEFPLRAADLKVFQVNIGRKCNQACRHCHVNASPTDTREMNQETAEKCLDIIRNNPEIEIVDLTGGAPEMNSNFRNFVVESRKAGKRVLDRCNLTILEEPGYEYLYDFLAENKVEIIASLPHFRTSSTDRQRGSGVYERSITALKKLNKLGYGNDLVLNLVYNPSGLFISSDQKELEQEFKISLMKEHGIVFNSLFCINNVPINRFLDSLIKLNKLEDYMEILVNSFNRCTIENLMCRHQISVGYDGFLYDCDFNQMLDLKTTPIGHIDNFDINKLRNRMIRTANHCFACTAGSGSS